MELSFCIHVTIVILSVGTNTGLAVSQSEDKILLKCETKSPSAWTGRQNFNGTFCEIASGVVDLMDGANIYLVILFIAAGVIVGVFLTLFVVKMKSLTSRWKLSAEARKNASRDTLHYYESLGSLANNFRHRVDQNALDVHRVLSMDTYINAPFTSLENRHLYINEQEEGPDAREVTSISNALEQSELDLAVFSATLSTNEADIQDINIPFSTSPPFTAVPHRNSHKKIYVNDQMDWETDNDGYIIPITPTNSHLSL